MNYSTAIFLISDTVRAMACTYEDYDDAPTTLFKTFDPSIQEGDYVVVPTSTRHKMTVVKVEEADIDIDIETGEDVQWIVGKVACEDFEAIKAEEAEAIRRIKAAEKRKKRDDLRKNLLADYADDLKALPITDRTGATEAEEPAGPPPEADPF